MTYNIKFLGTCACDFSPKLETEFKHCFDKDARRSSAALMNGQYLIDCGVHTLESLAIANIDTADITDVFITHTHRDHFNRDHIAAIAAGHEAPLRLWIKNEAEIEPIENVEIIKMESFVKYEVSAELSVIGMHANHSPAAFPQHFIFEKDGKKFFYGCDGGWFLNETWKFLKKSALALAVLDCTTGDYLGDFRMAEHNSIPMIRLMLPSMRTIKMINDETVIYFSHLAPSLHESHEKTVEIAKELNCHVAYDGLDIEV